MIFSRKHLCEAAPPYSNKEPETRCPPARVWSAWISSDFPPVTTAVPLRLLRASTLPGKRWRLPSLIGFDAIRLLWNLVRSFPLTFHPAVTGRAARQVRLFRVAFPLLINSINRQNLLCVFYVEIHAVDWWVKKGSSPCSPHLKRILTKASWLTCNELGQVHHLFYF